jgi:hypothetical protein
MRLFRQFYERPRLEPFSGPTFNERRWLAWSAGLIRVRAMEALSRVSVLILLFEERESSRVLLALASQVFCLSKLIGLHER